jgi:hypothetical protein
MQLLKAKPKAPDSRNCRRFLVNWRWIFCDFCPNISPDMPIFLN